MKTIATITGIVLLAFISQAKAEDLFQCGGMTVVHMAFPLFGGSRAQQNNQQNNPSPAINTTAYAKPHTMRLHLIGPSTGPV